LATLAVFAGVLGLGAAAASQCGVNYASITLPTTPTTTRATTTTTTFHTSTTTVPLVINDPSEEMVSVTPDGMPATYPNDAMTLPNGVTIYALPGNFAMTPDGRYVAFESTATDLVPGDTNNLQDIFVRDRVTGTTQRVSVKSDGSQITSADLAGTTSTYAAASLPEISADGRFVTFSTSASLVASDTDNSDDVYLVDRATGAIELISVSMTGGGSGTPSRIRSSISGDGRYVVFATKSTNLVSNDVDPPPSQYYKDGRYDDVFLRDRVNGTTTLVSNGVDGSGASGSGPSITPDGRYVLYQGYLVVPGIMLNNEAVVYDTTNGTVDPVGLDESGQPVESAPYAISDDGNTVIFQNNDSISRVTSDTPPDSGGGYAVHLYARNRSAGTTILVDNHERGFTNDRSAGFASVSSDGRYVAFNCWCFRVTTGPYAGMGHAGVFRTDLVTRSTSEVDANVDSVVANADSEYYAKITGDGASILFGSWASNLVPGDDNNHADLFISTPH
jgi:hypothetical protein